MSVVCLHKKLSPNPFYTMAWLEIAVDILLPECIYFFPCTKTVPLSSNLPTLLLVAQISLPRQWKSVPQIPASSLTNLLASGIFPSSCYSRTVCFFPNWKWTLSTFLWILLAFSEISLPGSLFFPVHFSSCVQFSLFNSIFTLGKFLKLPHSLLSWSMLFCSLE